MPVPTPSWAVRNGLNAEFLDADGRYPADETTYDNGSSGLTATDVQAAIDEIAGGTAAALTVEDEGTPLTTAADTLNFVGAGVTASGTGSTKTITIPGGDPDPIVGFNLTRYGLVLPKGSSGWDASLVESPCVFLDQATGQYAMTFSGYASGPSNAAIGLAYSDDAVNWTKYASNPILAGSGSGDDAGGCTGSFIVQEGGTYYLFYIGLTSTTYEGGTKSICLATSSSLTGTWTRLGAIITTAGSGWRQTAVWHPNVFKKGDTWYLFFNASNGSVESIGYATASSLTGPWTVDDVNSPVLQRSVGEWDTNLVNDPFVFRLGELWYMAYGGGSQDGYAFTTEASFPLGWTKYPGNPVVSPSGTSPDISYATKPFIFFNGDKLLHYYSAGTGGVDAGRQIGLHYGDIPVTLLPEGNAGGDLSGRYPEPVVAAIQGVVVTDAGTTGDVLTKTGAATATWAAPAVPSSQPPPILLASDHSVPFTFDEILQASDGSDFLYASE